ncbi:MAG: Cytochrome C oxidase subunit II [Shouchella clausii]
MSADNKAYFSIGCGLGIMVMLFVWLFVDLLF